MASDEQLTLGLCPACLCIDFDKPDLSYDDRPIADVVAGSKIGCTFCGLLTYSLILKNCMVKSKDASMAWVCLSKHDPLRGADNQNCITAESHDYSLLAPMGETATFDITIIRDKDETSEDAIRFLAPGTPPLAGLKFEQSQSVLKRSFDWIRKQLDKCTASHDCGTTSEMPLPTRIIDLGDHESPKIRLVVPEKGAVGRYAALSYCWGRSNHFVLTDRTFKDLLNGFHLSQLPKTLQHAVEVTREVGLRYLWVDALCIIQGQDGEAMNDWNNEVAKMDSVYRNAFVTISAAAAQNASGGLFNGSYCDLPFVSSWSSSGSREVVLWNRVTWRNDNPGFKSEPINSRAWTLQENTFSSRILFYTSFGLLWQCKRKLIWAYSGESRECDNRNQTRTKPMWPSTDGHEFLARTSRYNFPVGQGGLLGSWMNMLELYTARNLTNPYDKLPALAAMTQKYSDSSGAQYLAGLWKSTFRQDLLWKHHPMWMYRLIGMSDAGNPLRSSGYRAPSWSWAAIDGMILSEWTGKNLESSQYIWLAEVTTYPVPVLVNPRNPFGGVVKMATELQMRGAVEVFNVHRYPKTNELVSIWPVEGVFDTGTLWVDDSTETAAWRGRETEPLFCLHILGISNEQGPVFHQQTRSSYALALLPVPGVDHTYIRVGLADINPEPNSPSSDPRNMDTQTVTIL